MQKKIIIAILLTVVIVSGSLGIISNIAVRETIDNALQHRLELSLVVARNIDLLLSNSLKRLYDISLAGTIDLTDRDWGPEGRALKKAFDYSIFSDGLFIIDKSGTVVYNYPHQPLDHINLLALPYAHVVMAEDRPFISDIFTLEPTKRKIIYILVPLKNKYGLIVGAVGAEIDPSAQNFNEIIQSVHTDTKVYMEVVDSHGVVIASNDAKRMFKDQLGGHSNFLRNLIAAKKAVITKCHRCHAATDAPSTKATRSVDIMAYAPLENASWGVSIVQPEKDILTPIARMKRSFLLVSIGFIGIALVLTIALSRRIVKPVHDLIDATVKIAEGDMTRAIAFGGTDEIGKLGSSFEVMRLKLADSLEELKKSNAELEAKVEERTVQIDNHRKRIKELLQKVITTQEEERKRIAREFHDVIMQDLVATLLKVDLCSKHPESVTPAKIEGIKAIIEKNIEDVSLIIKNLRPLMLDDLGFVASVRWLAEFHLESKGISCYVNIDNAVNDLALDPQAEIQLFRIMQEAIINISRHAAPKNVFILIGVNHERLNIEIEDDGCGFDTESLEVSGDSTRGLGILGMKERASFLNWDLKICSEPGKGTRIGIKAPLASEFDHV
ncbi:MAG: HAMP domain-containing protein [Nitrospirae bacterium]|nr:MAG: HAMP domain-containing protein [Nitrospirota bacterium]